METRSRGWTIGDDWISLSLPDLAAVHSALRAVEGKSPWLETVPGLDSLTVQFDPNSISSVDATATLRGQLEELETRHAVPESEVAVPACFSAEMGPDRSYVAECLGIDAGALPQWLESQRFSVAMLGFMPGFVYLQSKNVIPEIGRLAEPRQQVIAGSVGIIGEQACIYSFDSPGGWPVVARTPLCLYDNSKSQPALFSPGQIVRFEAIDADLFEEIQSGRKQWP